MARADLTADRRDTVGQGLGGVDVDDRGFLHRHHAVVGHHREQSAGRQAVEDRLDQGVHLPQLHTPRVRAGTVHVSDEVEVGVIGVAEAAVDEHRPDRRGEIAQRVDPAVASAAQHRTGEAGAVELRAGDDADLHAAGLGALEHRLPWLHGFGRDVITQVGTPRVGPPAQRVDDPDAGQPERHPDHAVLARATAGTHRGQARRGGRRETHLQGLAGQSAEYRRVGGVAVQQIRAETVDEQHTGTRRLVGQGDPGFES